MFTALHHGLLCVLSFAAILTMFASAIGLVAWPVYVVCCSARVRFWHEASDQSSIADGRFWGEADTGRLILPTTPPLLTHSGQRPGRNPARQ